MSKSIQVSISEDDLIASLFSSAQASCGFDEDTILETDHNLWHLHCCDYNEPIYKVSKQIDLEKIENENNREYLKQILKHGKEYYEGEEG